MANSVVTSPRVYAAMIQAMATLSETGIKKTGKNTQQGYAYRSIDAILNHLSAVLPECHLVIFPDYQLLGSVEYQTKTGVTMTRSTVQATFTVVCSVDGSSHQFSTIGEAADTGDKSIGKAQSYALKKALEQVFCIPFEGQDSDADSHEQATPAVSTNPADIKPLLETVNQLRAQKGPAFAKWMKDHADGISVTRLGPDKLQALVDHLHVA